MSYKGGKGSPGVYHRIINEMPPHRVYIEPFLGEGTVIRKKRPAQLNIGCDLNEAAVDFCQREIIKQHDNSLFRLSIADAFDVLDSFPWQGDELVYLDPPYLMETRAYKQKIYKHELTTREDHARLLKVARSLPCRVMISGYPSRFYSATLRDWRSIRYQGMTRRGKKAEVLWCNFEEPVVLHDASLLGDDYRDRERIKRKAKRWRAGLDRLDPLERQAILSELVPLLGDYAPLIEALTVEQDEDAPSIAAE